MTVNADEVKTQGKGSKIEPQSIAMQKQLIPPMWSTTNSALPVSAKRRMNGKKLWRRISFFWEMAISKLANRLAWWLICC